MKLFRNRSGDVVDEIIDRVRRTIEMHGVHDVLWAGAAALDEPMRETLFAIAADLVLVDGKADSAERRFLRTLAEALSLDMEVTGRTLQVITAKNRLD
jgi:hypothetical protein